MANNNKMTTAKRMELHLRPNPFAVLRVNYNKTSALLLLV